MKKDIFKVLSNYGIPLVIILLLSVVYFFNPLMEGKEIQQSDNSHFIGMSKEIVDYREATGEEALWTNSMFGGMPAYLISTYYKTNLMKYINRGLQFLRRPASQVFLLLTCAYIAFLLFGFSPWISLAGALVVSFSSYNFIIIAVGHNAKVYAIAYAFPVIASIYHTFRKNALNGGVFTAIFLSLLLLSNHLQITYYTLMIVLIYGAFELAQSIKDHAYNKFLKPFLILLFATVLSVGANFSTLWTTYEYGKYSMRGESELTHDADNKTKGLDRDYATDWSYGIGETFTLLIPNFMGGPSYGSLSTNSATYEFFKSIQGPGYAKQVIKQMPTYYGNQSFTAGPIYFGAVIIFLFVIGLFLIRGNLKWWLLIATALSIMLAWGRNFPALTDFFLDYIPGYNKFRTVSMTLVIAQFTVPILGIFAFKEIVKRNISEQEILKAIKYSFYIVGGFTLLFVLFPGLFFDFEAQIDKSYIAQGGQQFVDALREDRKMILRNDALRSFIFILLTAVVFYLWTKKKLKYSYLIGGIIILILVDLWGVDKRYLNDDNFVSKRQAEMPFPKTQADEIILQDKDPNFRVLNLTVSTFMNASTSYYHKSLGGYHGAKMKRYQELIEFHISQNNMDVLNMLNTKYFIVPDKNRNPVPQRNPNALGNAWFVEEVNFVEDADEEIEALYNFDPSKTVIVDKRYKEEADTDFHKDTGGYIRLTGYQPNKLDYEYMANGKQLVVFSEIYYPKGWNAYIDGTQAEHFRANYVLRAMMIPGGKHKITFEFKPKSFFVGNKISLISSSILLLLLIGIAIRGVFIKINIVKY